MNSRTLMSLSVFVLGLASHAAASDYYLSATGGSLSNPGTQASPWPNLQSVAANKVLQPGDVLILMAGHHGSPQLAQANTGYVIVRPQAGARATLKRLTFASGARFWQVQGLEISPETAPTYTAATLISMSGASDIIIEDCLGYSVQDTSAWTEANWNALSCDALSMSGSRNVVRRNVFKNVDFGISVDRPGTGNLIQGNTIDTFDGDGLRGLADFCTFEYNLVKNCVATNDNHDDGFQSWTNGPGGVGSSVVRGVVLRGNIIINYEDPNLKFRGELQGIGCFDGFFEDWIVENNVVLVDHWHGISFYGARNCKFLNNTVVDINTTGAGPSWLMVTAHKNGSVSSGNLVRNNLVSDLSISGNANTTDHNLETTNYAAHFVNWAGRDLRLKAGSTAIDAGSSTEAPLIDLLKAARPAGAAWDLGAYEFGAGTPTPGLPTVTVAATDASAAEPSATGTFTFTRTGSTAAALTVTFTVGGTATSGTDYGAIGTSVTIAAGSAGATKTVTPLVDGSTEAAETVTVTLAANPAYTVGVPSNAIVTIQDAAGGGGSGGGGSTGGGSGGGGGGDGNCGATGLEFLLIPGLLLPLRRRACGRR